MADPEDLTKVLRRLIAEYQSHVHQFVQAFHRRFGVEDLLRAWRRGEVPRQGTLNDRDATRFTVSAAASSRSGAK